MKLYGSDRPYPFSILSDGLTVIGVHQAEYFSEPHITYFGEDMPDRIAAFKRNGIDMTPVSPEIKGRIVNARFAAPGGQKFFMLIGEV
jgi:hypothetical protein